MRRMETMASCSFDPPYSDSALFCSAGELLSIPFLAVLHTRRQAGNVYVGEQDAFTWLKLVKKPVPRRVGGYGYAFFNSQCFNHIVSSHSLCLSFNNSDSCKTSLAGELG